MVPTRREIEIVSKLSEGYSSKEIGHQLFISQFTVETHKRNLMMKMNAKNTVHLAILAERKGLLQKSFETHSFNKEVIVGLTQLQI